MGQQSVTITCVGKGRPQLQVLKLLLFGVTAWRIIKSRIAHYPTPARTNSVISMAGKQVLSSAFAAGQKFGHGKTRLPGSSNRAIQGMGLKV
jgi:hypothetical protein